MTKSKTKGKSILITKSQNKKGNLSQDKFFLVVDGSVIKNIQELADAFDRMSNDVFYYHVTEYKNDFETWVRDIFGLIELAEEMKYARSPERAEIAILKYLLKKM